MATGAAHPYGSRPPRHPLWKHRGTGLVNGPAYVALSTLGATASATDPGDSVRATNRTAIVAAMATVKAQGKALLVDGTYWWDAGASSGLDLSADGVAVLGRTAQAFPGFTGRDGFVGKVSSAPASPKNGVYIHNTTGQELWSLMIRGVGASVRGTTFGHHGLGVASVTGFRAVDCEIADATAASTLSYRAVGAYFGRHRTSGGLADAFHVTGGSNQVYAEQLSLMAPQDDYGAVVSYVGDPAYCANVTVRRVLGRGQTLAGRALTVVGGKNVLYEDANISGTLLHGLYAASESGGNATLGVDDFTYRRCHVWNLGSNGHGMFAEGRSGLAGSGVFATDDLKVKNGLFDACNVANPTSNGARAFTTFYADSIAILNGESAQWTNGAVLRGNGSGCTIDGWRLNMCNWAGFEIGGASFVTGTITIKNLTVTDVNAGNHSADVVKVTTGLDWSNTTFVVSNITHSQPTVAFAANQFVDSAGTTALLGTVTGCTSPWANTLGTNWS